ncbi:hypothetical protein FGO68_gene6220 [Halteria grandinella]|uniref:Uncharacterized protein n=1 Tax=Halteria grandinella TaxID=5974 RepID=A0A8J8NVG6_HALGN|nr:hypothetical protein FGO68_gene6220 [Halteria grandinella]
MLEQGLAYADTHRMTFYEIDFSSEPKVLIDQILNQCISTKVENIEFNHRTADLNSKSQITNQIEGGVFWRIWSYFRTGF